MNFFYQDKIDAAIKKFEGKIKSKNSATPEDTEQGDTEEEPDQGTRWSSTIYYDQTDP